MFTFHVSLDIVLIALALIVLLVGSLAGGLWWLVRALRECRLGDTVRESARTLKAATTAAAAEVSSATEAHAVGALELVRELRAVQDGISNLAPASIRDALSRVAKLHAKEMTEEYRRTAQDALQTVANYQLWLRGLTGGPGELSRAATQGYPKGLPEDLAGRLDAVVSQRRMSVKGRQEPTSGGERAM